MQLNIKYLSIIAAVFFLSCNNSSLEIKNNSYKGYGFFYSYLLKEDGRRELIFIPVNNSIEELRILIPKLKTGRGISFSSSGKENETKEIYRSAQLISLKNRKNYPYELQHILLTLVYIEFEESKNNKEKKYPRRGYKDTLSLLNKSYNLIYDPTQKDISDLIEVKELKIITPNYNKQN